jgi:hypothetical protein
VNTQLDQLVLLSAYREQRQHFFPSQGSLDWFLRRHRQGLVQAGALFLLSGRWFADLRTFDDYVMGVGATEAKKRT